jgi:hypothetical protein
LAGKPTPDGEGHVQWIPTWLPAWLAIGASEVAQTPPEAGVPAPTVPAALRIAATLLRTAFIILLLAVTLRVSAPQSETIWSAYETPSDLIRMVLGILVCIWFAIQLFRGPEDAQGYRTWLYLGLAAVPFTLICLIAVW